MARKRVRITCADEATWKEVFEISIRAGRALYGLSSRALGMPRSSWDELCERMSVADRAAIDELIGQGRLTVETDTEPASRHIPTREEAEAALRRAAEKYKIKRDD